MEPSSKKIPSILILMLTILSFAQAQSLDGNPKILYSKFNMAVGDEKYKRIQEYLPQILITHLIDAPVTFTKQNNIDQNQIQRLESSDSSKYDFYLMADYSVSREQFYINAYLYNFRNHSYKYLKGASGPTASILDRMKSIGDELSQYLNLYNAQSTKKLKLAVKCFASSDDLGKNYGENLALGLTVNLSRSRVTIVPWDISKALCNTNKSTLEVMDRLEADAVLSGEVKFTNNEVFVSPWVAFRNKPTIYLPQIIETKFRYADLEQNVLSDINDFLNNFIGDSSSSIEDLNFESDDYRVFWDKGNEYFGKNKYYMAAYMFNKSLLLNPKSDTVMTNLAIVRKWQERYDEAINIFKRVIERNPKYEDALYGLSATYFSSGNYNASIETLYLLRNINPKSEEITLLIARCFLFLNENKKAIAWYRRSLLTNTDNLDVTNELGQAYYNNNNYDSALYFFRKVIAIDPNDSSARSFTGLIYIKQGTSCFAKGKYQDAIKTFELAKKYSPTESVYNYLLLSNNKVKQFEQSNELIDEGLKLGLYDSATVYLKQAKFLRTELYRAIENENSKGIAEFGGMILKNGTMHILNNPKDPNGYWILANTYINLDSTNMGIRNLERAIALDSTNFSFFLDLGEAYIINDSPQKVKALFESFTGKEKLSDRDKIISYFLRSAAGIMLDNRDKFADKQLQSLAQRGERIYDWSFYAFDRWLKKSQASSKELAQVKELTSWVRELSI